MPHPSLIRKPWNTCCMGFYFPEFSLFVASCSADVWVSSKIEKVEKNEAVNHYWEQQNVANKIV